MSNRSVATSVLAVAIALAWLAVPVAGQAPAAAKPKPVPNPQTAQQVFEYACHEGNYGLSNILSAARADERKAEEAAKGK